jgi:redox-sensitive bicupin YhaK (pirin superfamily)
VRFLLISASPLGEPIAGAGPFVMNTRQEIEQALRDLREGHSCSRKCEELHHRPRFGLPGQQSHPL